MDFAKDDTLVDEELKDRLMSKEILAYIASQFVDDFAHMSWKQVLPYLEDPLGGGVSKAGPILLDEVHATFERDAFHACKNTKILLAKLGNDAGIYGAAKLVIG